MTRYINNPVPLMRALQQLSPKSGQCDLASIYFHLRRNLGSRHLLQSEPVDMQVAVRLDREQRRRSQRIIRTRIGIQDAVPRTLGPMRREPFGEISGRKLVGCQIELKHTTWNGGEGGAPNHPPTDHWRRATAGGCEAPTPQPSPPPPARP